MIFFLILAFNSHKMKISQEASIIHVHYYAVYCILKVYQAISYKIFRKEIRKYKNVLHKYPFEC